MRVDFGSRACNLDYISNLIDDDTDANIIEMKSYQNYMVDENRWVDEDRCH
jgi:hypothetical protein